MAQLIGLAVSTAAVVEACTKVGAQILDIQNNSVGVPAAVESLASDCITTVAVLERLQHLLRSRPNWQLLSSRLQDDAQDLVDSFDGLVQGLRESVQDLSEEVSGAYDTSNGKADLSGTPSAGYEWNESLLKELSDEIRGRRSALCGLLDRINT